MFLFLSFKDESVCQLKLELEKLQILLTEEKEFSNEWRSNYELMQQKHNRNLRTTEELLHRVTILEQRSTSNIGYIDDC